MVNEIEQIIENYNMGFITAYEVCSQFLHALTFLGADKALAEQMDKELQPLARFLMDNFQNHRCNRIEDFQDHKKDYI